MRFRSVACVLGLIIVTSCATLRDVVQPPRFSIASGRLAELRLIGPSIQNPLGGAAVRIWARVENPNPVGLVLSGLTGNFFLDDTRAAAVNFPLGLPLLASRDTVIPLGLSFRFSDLPGLANVATGLITRSAVGYRIDGTITVDAGVLGQPSFGPSTWLSGELAIRR
jgi:hypothetical protein